MRILSILEAILLFASLSAGQSLQGVWDGTVRYDDYKIPFPIEFSQHGQDVTAAFFNGDDRVTSTTGTLAGNTLSVNFDHYATRLTAEVVGGVVKGTYGNNRYGFHEFEARPHKNIPAPAGAKTPDISGVWDLPNESPKGEHAWNLIIRQEGAEAAASILRVDGDTGTLTGRFEGGKWTLNHFDGARASVLEILPKPDGTLDVTLKGFHGPPKEYAHNGPRPRHSETPVPLSYGAGARGLCASTRFVAVRLEQAKIKGVPLPTDPDEHTRMKDWKAPLQFSFPDLSGKLVSNTDSQFQGKVVLVNVTGSWCPNCHDEAPFLASIYRKYHSRGLEIVALDFEESEQRKDPTRLQAFIKKYAIEYTYLLAGEPSELEAKLPQAENLNSWPTTFFIGRDGRVRAIHAGFAAAATGPFNAALKKEINERIENLLVETERASRVR